MALRFTLRDLFLMTTLIAVGIYGSVAVATHTYSPNILPWLMAGWFVSWAVIGAVIGALFQRKMIGALIGLPLGLVAFMIGALVARS